MPKVFLTGITGFCGSHMADYILENHPEWEVVGLKRWRSPMINLEHIEHKIKLINGDLRDLSSMIYVMTIAKPEKIFHIAAQSYVPISYTAPNDSLVTNIIGTLNLMEAVRISQLKTRILTASSSEVYAQAACVPTDESATLQAHSPYAVSKIAEDTLSKMYCDAYGMEVIISRGFSHTGPRHNSEFVMPAFCRQIAKIELGKQPPIIKVGNLDSVRTFCHVKDMVRAYWMLLEKGVPSEAYNIGGNTTISIRDMLGRLIELTTFKGHIEVVIDPQLLRPKDILCQIPNSSKFKALTQWEPQISFEQLLSDTLEYWREREHRDAIGRSQTHTSC